MNNLLKIDVDVCENDYDDIKYGGPAMLGFTFYVSDDINKEDFENIIRVNLSKNGLPCKSIRFTKVPDYKIWSKEEIIDCINKNKNSFK